MYAIRKLSLAALALAVAVCGLSGAPIPGVKVVRPRVTLARAPMPEPSSRVVPISMRENV